jgi:hypothetical protein
MHQDGQGRQRLSRVFFTAQDAPAGSFAAGAFHVCYLVCHSERSEESPHFALVFACPYFFSKASEALLMQ